MNKFVKTPVRLSKEAAYLLANLNAQTHPDLGFRAWVEDPNKDTSRGVNELLSAGLIQEINSIFSPTTAGVHYFDNKGSSNDAEELIRKIKQILPPNPKFGIIVRGLSDTALIGLIHECLGEIGYRGNPDVPEKAEYWQTKVTALSGVLTDATPDTLWDRHQKQMESFGDVATKTVKKGKKA